MRLWFFVFALVVFSCGTPSSPACDSASCQGCCDAAGVCQAGSAASACGANGFACQACSATTTCVSGACVAPSGTGGGSGGGGGSALTAAQQEFLTAHDAVRASAMPTPSPPLPATHWSAAAQALAEDWAARCDFNHRNPNTLGENLSAGTAASAPTVVVNDWASERADYTYATNTCRAGQACGHYTQVVWRSSVGVGCAQQRCTTGSPFGSGVWYFAVCNYEPAGNYIGQKPY